mmetsp:Transcript_40120/g.45831  ORF Transcript_40120/g.45831 Transcript_40120/m.45831 type:complete len:101 (+) Transcript_40120:154-456(+)
MATTAASKTTEEDVRKKANYTTVYSFDTETMQVTYVAHDSFYLSLSFSLSDKSVSVTVTSKFISLSPTIIHVVSPNQIKIFPTCQSNNIYLPQSMIHYYL